MRTRRNAWVHGLFTTFVVAASAACGGEAPESATAPTAAEDDLDLAQVKIGRGVDGPADEIRGFCVEAPAPTYQNVGGVGATGQITKSELFIAESSQSLQESLDISAAAHIRWLAGKVDASVQRSIGKERKATSLYAVLHVSVQNATATVDGNVKLMADAENLLMAQTSGSTEQARARFRQRCGTHYVSGMTTGGEFYAIIEASTTDEADRQSLSVKISGSAWGQSASVDIESKINQTFSNRQISVTSFQVGGVANDSASCADIQCLVDRYKAFAKIVSERPVVTSILMEPYTNAVRRSDATTPLDVRNQELAQADISKAMLFQKDTVELCEAAISRPDSFVGPLDNAVLERTRNNANANIASLRTAARECYLDSTKCAVPAMLDTSGRPRLKAVSTPPAPPRSSGGLISLELDPHICDRASNRCTLFLPACMFNVPSTC